MKVRLQPLAALAIGLLLSGCPLLSAPQLSVTPAAISYGQTNTQQFLNIQNTGGGTLSWSVDEVARVNENSPWTTQPNNAISEDVIFGNTQTGLARVTLNLDRTGLPVGLYHNIGVRVASNGGTTIVPIAFSVKPTLVATPSSFTLSAGDNTAKLQVQNTGSATASWEIKYLPNPNDLSSATALPADFQVSPNPSSTTPGTATDVTLLWDSSRTDFSLLLESAAGSTVLPFTFGGELEGLKVVPVTLTLFVKSTDTTAGGEGEGEGEGQATSTDEVASKLAIQNISAVSRSWNVEIRAKDSSGVTPAISADPSTGTTAPDQETAVSVKVTDATKIEIGSGKYELVVRSNSKFFVVPITIEQRDLPVIAISKPPDPENQFPPVVPQDLLDLGRDEVQGVFWVANTEQPKAPLSFRIDHDDIGVDHPLIISVDPLQGDTNKPDKDFYSNKYNTFIDGTPISVTIDRSALTQDVEYREIRVIAYDQDFTAPISAVDVAKIKVRVERQPLTIEGAINRTRPPYVLRFVFLLRDDLNAVIPTLGDLDRQRLSFVISENDQIIDVNETNSFITGPADLKVNLVLMLDYTGSMFHAGTDSTQNPLQPGQAIDQVKAAAARFLDDLPPGYRVAIMYHADRNQPSRLISNFSTNREVQKKALAAFSVPDTLHGVSDIYDAVGEAVDRIIAEDSNTTLSFDDADVRAVVFVTDGRDASSKATADDIKSKAKTGRVRLYPLLYSAGSQSSAADLITMAHDTGGHLYNGGDVRNLSTLLANDKGLTIDPGTVTGIVTGSPAAFTLQASFTISNTGDSRFNWRSALYLPWITSIVPDKGTLDPGESSQVVANISPSAIGAFNTVADDVYIVTDNDGGLGHVLLQASIGADVNADFTASVKAFDQPGRIWDDLQNQVVLTYLTPKQRDYSYNITARYVKPNNQTIAGSFQNNAIAAPGDTLAGQLSLVTDGIVEDYTDADPTRRVRAVVYLRCDYAPRDVNRFRLRLFTGLSDDVLAIPGALEAFNKVRFTVAFTGALAGNSASGQSWRIIDEPDGVYNVLTDEANSLPYGSFSNMLEITASNLQEFYDLFANTSLAPEFLIGMRADNQIYVSPATPGQPSRTKYFLYPGSQTFPDGILHVTDVPTIASPARSDALLQSPGIDPEAEFAWDRDKDGIPDFDDPAPDDKTVPGLVGIPNPTTITADDTSRFFTVRNQTLNSMTWSLDTSALAAFASVDTTGARFTLLPGETSGFTVNVDRAGLTDNNYNFQFTLNSDTLGAEVISGTMVVQASGRLVSPSPVLVPAGISSRVLTIKNSTQSNFTWALDTATLPAWATLDTSGSTLTLAPGASSTFTLNLNRNGLAAGYNSLRFYVTTDTGARELVHATVVQN